MKTKLNTLPKKEIRTLYVYSKPAFSMSETSTQGDTTSSCTTVLTTTHFNKLA